MNDNDYSYDTRTTGYSKVSARDKLRSQVERMVVHGHLKVGLPYMMDIWTDYKNQRRISVQIQLLSGQDGYKKVFVRVSQSKKELIFSFPMSENIMRSDFAFETFLIDHRQLSEQDKRALKIVLKHHSKTAAPWNRLPQ